MYERRIQVYVCCFVLVDRLVHNNVCWYNGHSVRLTVRSWGLQLVVHSLAL